MGAFNTVQTSHTCPSCDAKVDTDVQFKFGDTFQYEYSVGDTIRWGGNDI